MVSISAAGTNEISEPTRYSLADKMEALDKENVKKVANKISRQASLFLSIVFILILSE